MILRIGSNGSAVAQLQLRLNELAQNGNFKLPVGPLNGTGTFGEKTEATVKAFQKKFDLEVDGVVGPQTFEKMDELRGWYSVEAAAPSTPKAAKAEATAREDLLLKLVRSRRGGRCSRGGRKQLRSAGARIPARDGSAPARDLAWCAAFTAWASANG